ncbi:MAG: electron transfer flavoprotein subunit beta/FixA family protein [Fimbriimonadaceae bacterium]|nr:electron transfer flavoprotein subunit beta/FixA family protein [Fimbriimonadaceae bacterium]
MKILVPVKRVVDPFAKVKALADGCGLDTASAKFDVNPFDEIAVEEAVRKKEADPTVQVTVASIGPAACEDQLRKALAIGADDAVLVETDDQLDPSVVAAELAALVHELKPDLVLMGKQATDDDGNQVGQMLAAKLGWPQATFASKLSLDGGKVTVTRETDTGEETLELPFPAVVTADLRLNEPRYIALPGIIKARSKPLAKRARLTHAHPKLKVVGYSAPPTRPAGRKVGSVDELVAALRERGVLA